METTLQETFVEAAACDALGAGTAAEAVAYQQQLGAQDQRARRLDRELRQTVARLAAASPHLEPPADLRARILEATAPATFNMEAYRKANQDGGRFYRWGFYAAMAFLMAGAWFNMSLQGKLKQANNNVAVASQQVQERDTALRAFVNPNTQEVRLVDASTGKMYGKALLDEASHTAVVILPSKMIPPNQTASFSYPNQKPYNTVLVRAPGDSIQAPAGKSLESALAVKSVQPDSHQTQQATSY